MEIDQLTLQDLDDHPVWHFPSDDGLTIEPVVEESMLEEDTTVIVKTIFTDANGKHYAGYLYWGEPHSVDYIRPVILFSANSHISFWRGIREPSSADIKSLLEIVVLPISYESINVFGLYSLCGSLSGVYYLSKDRSIAVKKEI